MRITTFLQQCFILPRADVKISSKNQNIAGVTPLHLIQKVTRKPQWKPLNPINGHAHSAQAGLAGSDPRGHSAAADIIVQLLLALFFAIVLNRSSPGLFVGGYNAPLPLRLCGGDADRTNRAGRRTGGIV